MIAEKLREFLIRRGQSAPRRTSLADVDLATIEAMFSSLQKGDTRARPSRYWEELNKLNVAQISADGYRNFKRTIALNYFTWATMVPWNSQAAFLVQFVNFRRLAAIFWRSLTEPDVAVVGRLRRAAYNWISLLLWEYILRSSLPANLLELREPEEGRPLIVFPRPGMGVTQDLGNSILEYAAFNETMPARATVIELGAGYGRTAFVILNARPDSKVIIIDIAPALWVAQRYLSTVFREKTIFYFRDFSDFNEVAEEFARADIVFLLSTQITSLPDDIADLVLNISSLHEMRPDQIAFYFEQFDRLLRPGGHMYTKQWREARVLFEQVTLVERDYPVPPHWQTLFSRQAAVQTKFYEALYCNGKSF